MELHITAGHNDRYKPQPEIAWLYTFYFSLISLSVLASRHAYIVPDNSSTRRDNMPVICSH